MAAISCSDALVNDSASDIGADHRFWILLLVFIGDDSIGLRLHTLLSDYELGKLGLCCRFSLDMLCDQLFNL